MSQSKKSTTYSITFSTPLNSVSANSASLYRVFEGVTKEVKKKKETVYTKALTIKSVLYDPDTTKVTITLAKPYKGKAQVTIAPGLEGADGATASGFMGYVS